MWPKIVEDGPIARGPAVTQRLFCPSRVSEAGQKLPGPTAYFSQRALCVKTSEIGFKVNPEAYLFVVMEEGLLAHLNSKTFP